MTISGIGLGISDTCRLAVENGGVVSTTRVKNQKLAEHSDTILDALF
jgi:hypothetical protein